MTGHLKAVAPPAPEGSLAVDDGALVERSRTGDDEAFARLFSRYRHTVYATCLRQLKDPALAEDVTQDTFLRAYTNLERFDTGRRMLPWLLAIAIRRCIDVRRRGAKVAISDPTDHAWADRVEPDTTLERVMAGEDRRRLEEALATLPERQRRAVLLYALEGWSYSDIASAEGVSIMSTKSLLWRARLQLKRACQTGALGIALVPFGMLRRKAQSAARQARFRLDLVAQPLTSLGFNSITAGALVLTFGIGAAAAAPAAHARPSATTRPAVAVEHSAEGARVEAARAGADQDARGFSAAETADELRKQALDPTEDANPEDTQFTSFAVSPAYERDHTIFAAGRVACARGLCPVLFVSNDGGASWVKRSDGSFAGDKILVAPGFPGDQRIYAGGPGGLQESLDGGRTFRLIAPVEGDIAISPAFDRGDTRVLVAGPTVLEYDADSGVVRPASLVIPAGATKQTITLPTRRTATDLAFVGSLRPDDRGVLRPSIDRCEGGICTTIMLEASGEVPTVRLGANDVAYAFTFDGLFASRDGGRSFEPLRAPISAGTALRDALVRTNTSLVIAIQDPAGATGGVAITNDEGRTWHTSRVGLEGFELGVSRLLETPGGTLVAAGALHGIACSSDGGSTWASRCS
jgi:RNA polymerase sigma-70 factor (ECF subfamily)